MFLTPKYLILLLLSCFALVSTYTLAQPCFPVEAYPEHQFRFDKAGLKIEFSPAENLLILRQAGAEHRLKRE